VHGAGENSNYKSLCSGGLFSSAAGLPFIASGQKRRPLQSLRPDRGRTS
jgi:hypothetical protein